MRNKVFFENKRKYKITPVSTEIHKSNLTKKREKKIDDYGIDITPLKLAFSHHKSNSKKRSESWSRLSPERSNSPLKKLD